MPERSCPLLQLRHPPQRTDNAQKTLPVGPMVLGCALIDGRTIAVATGGGIDLWEFAAGRRLSTLDTGGAGARWLMSRPDQATLVALLVNETWRRFDLSAGTQQELPAIDTSAGDPLGGRCLPDRDLLLFPGADGELLVTELLSSRMRRLLREQGRRSACATVSPDGRQILAGDVGGELTLWERDRGLVRSWAAHADPVTSCAITPDGLHAISGSADYTVKVWELASARLLGTWSGHTWQVSCLDVTPDGHTVLSGGFDGQVRVWSLSALLADAARTEPGPGSAPELENGHAKLVTRCAMLPGGRALSASYDGTARLWDLGSGREVGVLAGHSSVVADCASSADGRLLATASWDRTVRLWNSESLTEAAVLVGHEFPVLTCAITCSGRLLSADAGGVMMIWDLETKRPRTRVLAHSFGGRHRARVSRCVGTADGQHALSIGYDWTLALWDVDSGRELWRVQVEHSQLYDCAIAPDGETVAAACHGGEIVQWSLRTKSLLRRIKGHESSATACVFSEDGRYLISGGHDGMLRLWCLASGSLLATASCRGPVRALATRGPDLVAGDAAGNVWMWQLAQSLSIPLGRS